MRALHRATLNYREQLLTKMKQIVPVSPAGGRLRMGVTLPLP
jgi:hypothetical protein